MHGKMHGLKKIQIGGVVDAGAYARVREMYVRLSAGGRWQKTPRRRRGAENEGSAE